MPKFSYTAVDARGKQANGVVDANDQNDAIAQIRQLGFYPQRLDEAKDDGKPRRRRRSRRSRSGAAGSRCASSRSSRGSWPR